MIKNAPLAFVGLLLMLLTTQLQAQPVGGWGTCEFSDVASMNAVNPANANTCKRAFVQASNEHYRWDGSAWVLEGSSSSNENIYTMDDTLQADRIACLDGKKLTFEGSQNIIISSTGQLGIDTTASFDLDVNGIANIEDRIYIGNNAGNGTNATTRIGSAFNLDQNSYQLYSSQTITSPTLTSDRTTYGAYFDILNNKTENIGSGFDSDAIAGFFQSDISGSNTFRNISGIRGYAENSSTAASNLGTLYGGYFRAYNNSSAGIGTIYGSYSQARGRSSGAGSISNAYGSRSEVLPYGASISNAYGLYGYVYTNNGNSGDITTATGLWGRVRVDSDDGGNITTGRAGYFSTDRRSGANIMTTGYGIQVDVNDAQTAYGVRVDADDSDATTNYGLYIDANGASSANYGIFGQRGDWVLDEDGNGASGTGAGGDLVLGEGQDLEIYHDGSNSNIINNTGDLNISHASTGDVVVQNNGGNLGVGTSSPTAKLHVNGGTVRFQGYGAGSNTGTQTFLLAVDANGNLIEVTSSGGSGNSNPIITYIYPGSYTWNGSNVNNWTPNGISSSPFYEVHRVNVTNDTDFTGINSSGVVDGQKLTIINIGNKIIKAKHQDSGSSAANRLVLPEYGDVDIKEGGSITFIYDSLSSRWRVYARGNK